MVMTQQQKAAFNQQYIYNDEVGWRERTLIQSLEKKARNIIAPNLSFENQFDRNYIYNDEVGWRERTEAERVSENLDRRFGPGLQAVGNGVVSALKYLAIGVGAGAAGLVAYNGFQVVLKQVEGV